MHFRSFISHKAELESKNNFETFNNMKPCMAFIQTRNWHLVHCVTVFLLICGDFTKAFVNNTQNLMNINVSKGENVILHCDGNRTSKSEDIGWRKDKIILFNSSPGINQTVINYTSYRMHVDPRNPGNLQISDVQPSDAGLYSCFPFDKEWILMVTNVKSLRQEQMLVFILTSGAVAVGLIIFCTVCIHRKWKKNVDIPPHGGGMNNNQSDNYIERLNSVYGQYHI
ncbi:uncharacterized protein LOC132850719 isoform X2 [Tachysurus vachellii]|uniref:uncharacterized protein LOC132850719 isoform X2 n=1 Tax=Tachysurus vachellii TaxID=175792 RepID=UPI00296AF2D2|nr:uncharacterized protein LOC132850719 isoform X2 [Tachysurus vachellii]